MVSPELLRRFVREKLKLLAKQEYGVVRDRFEAIRELLQSEAASVVLAGGLQEAATGTVFEPPFLCEWILEPFKHIFCPPPEGSERNMKLDKAIYGVTKYGWSFYDPAYDVLHIIKTLQHALVRPELSKRIGRILVGSGVSEMAAIVMVWQHRCVAALARAVYRRGPAPVLRSRDIYGRLETVYWDGVPLYRLHVDGIGEVLFDTVSALLIGFVVGVTPLGYGFLLPRGAEVFSDGFFRWLASRVTDVLVRFLPGFAATKASKKTVMVYGLPMTYEHEEYGAKRALVYMVKRRVWAMLEGLGLDTMTRQAYVSAALELVFAPLGPKGKSRQYVRKYKHDLEWGELVRHWRAKWEALGLKGEVLDTISKEVYSLWCLLRSRETLRKLLVRGSSSGS